MSNKIKVHLSLFLIFFIVVDLFLFQNCGVQKPQVENAEYSSMQGFSHNPIPASCVDCHSNDRPTTASTLSSDFKSNLFYHTAPYGGDSDCSQCHTQNSSLVGNSWRSGVFNHKNNFGSSITTCNECHTGNMPAGLAGASQFNHSTIGAKQCLECHKNTGSNWSVTSFSHSPLPNSCSECHSSSLPSSTQYFPSNPNTPKLNLYVHATMYRGNSNCVECHTDVPANAGVTWAGAKYNHKSNTGVTINTCINCHTGNRPNTHTAANGRMGDCNSCHTNTGVNWTVTSFSHSPLPNSCSECHSSSLPSSTQYFPSNPTAPTKNLYAHATAYRGGSNCVECHTAVPANAGVTWAGAKYNHKSNTGVTINTCINCHTGNRPNTHTAANGQLGDCNSCHTNAGVNWNSSGGAIPASVTMVAPTGTLLKTITIKHPSVQSGMSCTTCHSNYNATNSIIGFDHTEGLKLASNGSAVANSCYYCHFSPGAVIDTAKAPNGSRSFTLGKVTQRSNSHEGRNIGSRNSCLDCHTANSPPAWNINTKTWTTGGRWNGG